MHVVRQRAKYIPSLNSYFITDFSQQVSDDIKASRADHLGGDKYLGKGVWEISREVWNRISHYPHEFVDNSFLTPEPLIFRIDPDSVLGKYHYQTLAAEELRKRKEALLFFDTGTGKTRTALLALSRLSQDVGAVIIVGESNLSKVWKAQVEEHFPEFSDRFIVLNDSPSIPKRVQMIGDADSGTIFIVNIESMRNRRLVEALNAKHLAVAVLDECQCIIGRSAQQTQGMHDLITEFRWALSATPIKNSPLEWYSLLGWLRVVPSDGAKTRFREYYAFATRNKFGGWEYTTFRNEQDLEDLKNLISIRVEKSGLGLPKRNLLEVNFSIDSTLSDILFTIRKERRKPWIDATFSIAGKEFKADTSADLFYIERLAFATAKNKVDFILQQTQEQIIVVSCLKFPLDYIHSLMPEESVIYHGGVSPEEREKGLEEFKAGKKRVLLMTRKSGGVGLTLVNSHIMYFLDAPENMANFNQCADRVHRIGQTKPVNIYITKIDHSIDTYAWQHLDEKQSWIERYYKVEYGEGES